jgi:membrane protein implicated in regulation of membrane protease activity
MLWWYWIFLGLLLLAADLITPGGFYLLFFGLAALAVGAIAASDLIQPAWVQWLLFSVLSVVSLLAFRGPLMARMKSLEGSRRDVDTMMGETAVLLDDLTPGGTGKAEMRGSTWTARNAGDVSLTKGQRVRIERVDGLTLSVKPDR